jgi:outer membrane protein TolC
MARTEPARLALGAAAVALLVAGCATTDPQAAFAPVAEVAGKRLGKEVAWPRDDAARSATDARIAELLARPLSADDAVQVALLNNRGLQAAFHDLGIAEADRLQAGRLPNPGFGYARTTHGGEVEVERGIHFNLARLIAMPWATQAAERRLQQVRHDVTMQVLQHASETRKAWIDAVAAQQATQYLRQAQSAADAGAELARRMARTGNFSRLQQAREQGFSAEAALAVARAELAEVAARERLVRLMGLWGERAGIQLPDRLPDLPKSPRELPDVERTAMAQRLDIQAARAGAEQLAQNLGLARATRFVNVLELGLVRTTTNEGGPAERGVEIAIELPLFDWGDLRIAKSEAVYMQALERTAQAAIDARSEVRQAYRGYRSGWDVTRHYRDEIVPIRKRISEENLYRYNGMLIGVFDLLADARAQIASVTGYIDALRGFWIAEADLEMALIGRPSGGAGGLGAAAAAPHTPAAQDRSPGH